MKALLAVSTLVLLAGPALAAETTAPAVTPAVPAATATATPAAAADQATPPAPPGPKLANFVGLVFSGTTGESAPEVDMDLTAGAALGTTPLQFEKTRLEDLVTAWGGTIRSQGDAGDAVSWLCYTQHARTKTDTPRTVWFTSTAEMAGPGGHTLSMVAVENVDAAKVSGCLSAPKGFAFPAFGVPAVGATLADLKQKFPTLHRDKQGNVYLDSARPLGDGSGSSVYQALGYRLNKKGKVLAITLSQVTTH